MPKTTEDLKPLLYEGREITAGKCGRCECSNPDRYLWCDVCEDHVRRVGNCDWIERILTQDEEGN